MLDKEIKESILSRINLTPITNEKIDIILVYIEELERGMDKMLQTQEGVAATLKECLNLALAMRKTDDLLFIRMLEVEESVKRLNINCTIGEKDTIVEARLKTFHHGHELVMKETENSLKRHIRLLKDLERLEREVQKIKMKSTKNHI